MPRPVINSVDTAGHHAANLDTLTFNFNNVGGTVLFVVVSASSNSGTSLSIVSIQYATILLSTAVTRNYDVSAGVVGIYQLLSPPTGSNSILIALASPAVGIHAGVITYTGTDLTTPVRQSATDASPVGADITATLPSANWSSNPLATSVIVDVCAMGTTESTNNQTLIWRNNFSTSSVGDNTATQRSDPSGGTAPVHSYTMTGTDWWGIAAVEIQAPLSQAVTVPGQLVATSSISGDVQNQWKISDSAPLDFAIDFDLQNEPWVPKVLWDIGSSYVDIFAAGTPVTVGATLIATSTLSGKARTAVLVKNQFICTSTISGAGKGQAKSSGTFVATSTLSGLGKGATIGKGQFIGTSTLSGRARTAVVVKNQFIATSTLSGKGTGAAKGLAAIALTSTLSATTRTAATLKSQFIATSTISGRAAAQGVGKGQLIGVSTLSGTGKGAAVGKGQFVVTSVLSGKAVGLGVAKGQLVATSTISGRATTQAIVGGTLVATSTLSGSSQVSGPVTITGRFLLSTSTLSAVGKGASFVGSQFVATSVISGRATGASKASFLLLGISTLSGIGKGAAASAGQESVTSTLSGNATGAARVGGTFSTTSIISGEAVFGTLVHAPPLVGTSTLSGRFTTPSSITVPAQFVLQSTITGTGYRNDNPVQQVITSGTGGGPPPPRVKLPQPERPPIEYPETVEASALAADSRISGKVKVGRSVRIHGRWFREKSVLSAKSIVRATRRVTVRPQPLASVTSIFAKASGQALATSSFKLDSNLSKGTVETLHNPSEEEIILTAYDLLAG